MTNVFTSEVLLPGLRGVSATVCCAAAKVGTASTKLFAGAGTVDAGRGDRSDHTHTHTHIQLKLMSAELDFIITFALNNFQCTP